MLTVGSLFSGIGGLDLGLERAGMTVRWLSEIDPYACKILKKHWPEVPNYGDIKQIDWRTVEPVDVICGGYPCQPFSTAGKRRGTDDPRHLWPWVRDAISALRPRYAILENVRGHLSMGGTTVIGELAEIGYDAEWRVVSAAGMGAPHRRDRIIIVAYPNSNHEPNEPKHGQSQRLVADTDSSNAPDGRQRTDVQGKDRGGRDDRSRGGSDFGQIGLGSTGESASGLANANGGRRKKRQSKTKSTSRLGVCGEQCEMANPIGAGSGRVGSLAQSGKTVYGWADYVRGKDGFTSWTWWETEPDVGRVADGVSHRVDRLRGLGNAVVPQVAEYIGRLVMAAELDNA